MNARPSNSTNKSNFTIVIPAKAGIQFDFDQAYNRRIKMDPGFRQDDDQKLLAANFA